MNDWEMVLRAANYIGLEHSGWTEMRDRESGALVVTGVMTDAMLWNSLDYDGQAFRADY